MLIDMKKGTTLFLKFVMWMIGTAVFAFCTLVLPRVIIAELTSDFDYLPIMLGMLITAIPFFIGLYNGLKLVRYIEKNKVFSESSIQALKHIKYCAIAVCGFYTVMLPYIFYIAQLDDAPGVVLLGFIFVFASLVVATAAGVFQHLLENVLAIKSENELTV